jgi:hypothetical protein
MFLNLTLASGHTSPIIASGILNPALAYLPCSRALYVKCRLLPEDLMTSPNIGAWHTYNIFLKSSFCSNNTYSLPGKALNLFEIIIQAISSFISMLFALI